MTDPNTKVWVNGISGKMGILISSSLKDHSSFTLLGGSDAKNICQNTEIVGSFDSATLSEKLAVTGLIIDFSSAKGNQLLLDAISEQKNTASHTILIGTTGLDKQLRNSWKDFAAKTNSRLLFAPNTSIGILTLAQTVRALSSKLTKQNFDIEIIETHHRDKLDSPSGTATFLADTIQSALEQDTQLCSSYTSKRPTNSIGVHSVRGGGVFGEHEIRFIGDHEELYLGHRALSRDLFAQGALRLSEWLIKQTPGVYGFLDVKL